MYIHSVPHGTKMEFTFDNETILHGKFDGNIDHMQFNVLCPEISRNIDIYQEAVPHVTFIAGENSYSFTATLLGINEKKDAIHDALVFRVATPFKATPLRQNFRIKVALKVRLHEYVDDYTKMYTNGWLFDTVSDDISKNGICLWCDYPIDEPIGTMFTLEFTLQTGRLYMVPAKLMRNQLNTATRSYNYEYGFNFDFSHQPDKQERLLLEILEYKIKNRM